MGKQDTSRRLLMVGSPSKSFLNSYNVSLLFDSDKNVFGDSNEQSRVIMSDTRTKYHLLGKLLEEKAADMLQDVTVGELSLVER